MRIALVGFGRWGRNHARLLAKNGWLHAVVDTGSLQRAESRRQYPEVAVYGELGQLPWCGIEGVVIASPVEQHVQQARFALERGKHCLVEKPLALAIEDVFHLQRLAQRSGCLLMTGHVLDYHPAVTEMLRLSRSGALGRLRYWHSARMRRVPLRNYVTVLYELLWHDCATLLRLVGRLPDRIRTVGCLVEDGAVLLEFGSFYATLRGSQTQPLRESQILVAGGSGAVVFDDEKPLPHKLRYQTDEREWHYASLDEGEPLARELDHFVAAATTQTPPLSGAAEALQVLELIEEVQNACTLPRRCRRSRSTRWLLSNKVPKSDQEP
jgi:UDP-2-acetamido-3-amino-2,3-dideoxy-glucuronate N-acetyltransferase